MRLTCPNCQAQYEVGENAIPEGGREVQCSNCKTTWFQERPVALAEPAPIPVPDRPISEPVVAEDRKPAGGTVEDSILSILREEAEREQQARAEDREAASSAVDKLARGLQEQAAEVEEEAPETADPDIEPKTEADVEPIVDAEAEDEAEEIAAPDSIDAESEPTAEEPEMETAEAEPDAVKPDERPRSQDAERLRDGALTDEERISNTLKEVTANLPKEEEIDEEDIAVEEHKGSSGFRRGFALVIVLFGLAMVCYSFAPTIVSMVPQAESFLTEYVVFVDKMRVQLDQMIINLVAMMEAKSGS